MCARVELARLVSAPMHKRLKTLLLILLTATSGTLSAAPYGYSINSDSASANPLTIDSLYKIDLATGLDTRIGQVGTFNQTRTDVEGLAFAPNGTLFGVDDDFLKLFPINQSTGAVISDGDVFLSGIPAGGSNDFGMTFDCGGNLYITSWVTKTLYRVDIDGKTTPIGGPGKLGVGISAIAAFGSPVQLFGLSNGEDSQDPANIRKLWSIDTETGIATEVGTLGSEALDYAQAGLAFDEEGILWALTDRRDEIGFPLPSQVLQISTLSGQASAIASTQESGFESLAISTPRGCKVEPTGDFATFEVRKQFTDGNNVTPVTFNFSCSSGTVTNPTRTIYPEETGFGTYQIFFVVDSLPSGSVSCQIEEVPLAGYTPSYECESDETICSTGEGAGPCLFEGVSNRDQGLCLVSNAINPVEVTVTKEWLLKGPETIVENTAEIYLNCTNTAGGDGELKNGVMSWDWFFDADSPSEQTAIVYPSFSGDTECWTEEQYKTSAVESESTCEPAISILPGDSPHTCIVSNSIFYEGIPTLNALGLVLASALLLMTGLVSVRRFA